MKFDELLTEHLGEFGKYQKMQFFLVCLPTMFTAIHALSWTFTGAIPDHRCKLPGGSATSPLLSNNTLYKLPEYEESCRRFIQNNVSLGTETCIDGYKWDFSEITYSAVNRWTIVCDRTIIRAVVQAMYYLGQLVGSLIFGFLGDRVGRKRVFFIAIVVQISAAATMSVAPHWFLFALLRCAVGFAHPGIFVIAVVIGSELVGPSKRKLAGVVTGMFFSVGQILLGMTAYFVRDYRYLQLVVTVPALVFISFWWLVPESARWLISKKRYEEAGEILQRAAKTNGRKLPGDWLERLDVPETAENRSFGIVEVFRVLFLRSKQLRLRSLVAFFCWPTVSMVYYGLSMKPDFLGGDRYVTFVAAGALEIPALFIALLMMDCVGRKPLLSACYLATSLCLFSTLILPESVGWLRIFQVIASKSVITAAYATIYTYTPELFPTPIRNTVMGCCSMVARIGAISASFVSMWLVEYSRVAVVCIFGGFALAAGLLSLLLPETVGATLPETLEDVDGIKDIGKNKHNLKPDLDSRPSSKQLLSDSPFTEEIL